MEGFRAGSLSEKNQRLIDDTDVSSSASASIIDALKAAYRAALAEYTQLVSSTASDRQRYVERVNPSNPYLSSLIKFSTGEICYVTAMGVARLIPTPEIRASLSLPKNARVQAVDVPFDTDYFARGEPIPTTPPLVGGPEITMNESIGLEGSHVVVDSMLAESDMSGDPGKFGCRAYGSGSQDNVSFIGGDPKSNEFTDAGGFTHEMCKSAAIQNNYRYFGLGNRNTTGDKTKGYCAVANTYDDSATAAVKRKSSIMWHMNTWGKNRIMSLTTSGTISLIDTTTGRSIARTSNRSKFPANYVGCYTDSSSRGLPELMGNNKTYDACSELAADKKYSYFGLQMGQPSGTGECWAGNDLDKATGLGAAANCTDKDGISLGGGWSNAVYSSEPSESFFIQVEDEGSMSVCRGTGPTDNQETIMRVKGRARDINPDRTAAKGKYGKNWMPAGSTLLANEFIGSPSGNCYLLMEGGGNLVLFTTRTSSNCEKLSDGTTAGNTGAAALYDVGQVGVPAHMNKVGYVTQHGQMLEYPDELLSANNSMFKMSDYDMMGDELSAVPDATAASCQSTCRADAACGGATFDRESRTCSLKKADGLVLGAGQASARMDSYVQTKTPTVLPDGAYPKSAGISSLQYDRYVQGAPMASDTLVGMSSEPAVTNSTRQQEKDQLKGRLDTIAAKLIKLTGAFNENDVLLSAQAHENADGIVRMTGEYESIDDYVQDTAAHKEVDNVLDDSSLVVVYKNRRYILWGTMVAILALLIAWLVR